MDDNMFNFYPLLSDDFNTFSSSCQAPNSVAPLNLDLDQNDCLQSPQSTFEPLTGDPPSEIPLQPSSPLPEADPISCIYLYPSPPVPSSSMPHASTSPNATPSSSSGQPNVGSRNPKGTSKYRKSQPIPFTSKYRLEDLNAPVSSVAELVKRHCKCPPTKKPARHWKRCPYNFQPESLRCNVCHRSYSTKDSLRKHHESQHRGRA